MNINEACAFIEEELTTGGQNYQIDSVLIVEAVRAPKDVSEEVDAFISQQINGQPH